MKQIKKSTVMMEKKNLLNNILNNFNCIDKIWFKGYARMEKKTRRCSCSSHTIRWKEKYRYIRGLYGHSGKEIVQFFSNYFIDELVKNKNLENYFSQVLKETFIKMDKIMTTP